MLQLFRKCWSSPFLPQFIFIHCLMFTFVNYCKKKLYLHEIGSFLKAISNLHLCLCMSKSFTEIYDRKMVGRWGVAMKTNKNKTKQEINKKEKLDYNCRVLPFWCGNITVLLLVIKMCFVCFVFLFCLFPQILKIKWLSDKSDFLVSEPFSRSIFQGLLRVWL